MAKQTISKLSIKIGADAKGVRAGVSQAKKEMQTLTKVVNVTKRAFIALGTAAAGIAAGFIGFGIKLAAEAETARVSFEVLTGSASEAKKTLEEIRAFAAATPFQTADLVEAGRLLLAFDTAASQIVPTLQRIGDVSAGIGAPIGEIAELYGKAQVQGRLFAEDINQLTGRGIPIIKELAKQFGVTQVEVRELVSTGKVGFKNLEQAFISMTSEGGKFFELTIKQSRTLAGQWSTLKDNVAALAREVGEVLVPTMLDFVEAAQKITKWLKNLNLATVANTAKMVAFAAAFGAALIIIPKIISAVKTIVLALRALATAQTTVLALSGPAGWATLAASIVIAASAAVAVHVAFKGIADTIPDVVTESKKAADEINGLTDAVADHMRAMKESAEDAMDVSSAGSAMASHLAALRDRLAAIVEPVKELLGGPTGALDIRTQAGLSSVNSGARERVRADAELKRERIDKRKRDEKRDKLLIEIFHAIVTGSTAGPPITVVETSIVG